VKLNLLYFVLTPNRVIKIHTAVSEIKNTWTGEMHVLLKRLIHISRHDRGMLLQLNYTDLPTFNDKDTTATYCEISGFPSNVTVEWCVIVVSPH
jgi:hypothetical protein